PKLYVPLTLARITQVCLETLDGCGRLHWAAAVSRSVRCRRYGKQLHAAPSACHFWQFQAWQPPDHRLRYVTPHCAPFGIGLMARPHKSDDLTGIGGTIESIASGRAIGQAAAEAGQTGADAPAVLPPHYKKRFGHSNHQTVCPC